LKTTLRSTLLLALILMGVLPLVAQEALTNTYDANGVIFDYPDGWEVMKVEDMIALASEDTLGFTMTPVTLQRRGLELGDDLNESIRAIFEGLNEDARVTFDADAVKHLSLGGREAVRYDFADYGNPSVLLAIRLRDGSIGAFGIVAWTEELQADDEATLLAVAATFDVSESSIDESTNTDGSMFTFPSGVGFDYPDGWTIDETMTSDTDVVLNGPQFTRLMVVDLQALADYANMSLEAALAFMVSYYSETFEFDIKESTQETVDFDGREATVYRFESPTDDEAASGILVITTNHDGDYQGLVMAHSLNLLTKHFEVEVLVVAESLDMYEETESVASDHSDSAGNSYTFPSCATFTYSDDWTLAEPGDNENIVKLDGPTLASLLFVFDLEALIGETDKSIEALMNEYAKSYVTDFGIEFEEDNYETLNFDGHEAMIYPFEGMFAGRLTTGLFMITTYSDGSYGQVIGINGDQSWKNFRTEVLAIAESLDISDDCAFGDSNSSTPVKAPVMKSYTFPSGATFDYLDKWTLEDTGTQNIIAVFSGSTRDSVFTVIDLKALTGNTDMSQKAIMNQFGRTFADQFDFEFDLNDYTTMDFAGREAIVYTVKAASGTTATTRMLAIMNYTGGGQGLVLGSIADTPAKNVEFEAEVLAIAASFDSE
jgi:hypothetical protein